MLGVNRKTVMRVHQVFAETGSVSDRPRTGRKRKLTEVQSDAIVDYAKKVN
jgi:transposase